MRQPVGGEIRGLAGVVVRPKWIDCLFLNSAGKRKQVRDTINVSLTQIHIFFFLILDQLLYPLSGRSVINVLHETVAAEQERLLVTSWISSIWPGL